MNNLVTDTTTQPPSTTTTSCMEDCYMLELMKEPSDQCIIISRLPLCCLLVIFASLTVHITRRTSRLTQRPATLLITNLGITGVLIGVITTVFTLIHLIIRVKTVHRVTVVVGVLIPRILHIVNTLTLACLTLDRYLALCMPLRYSSLVNDARCYLLVIICWMIPIVVIGLASFFGYMFSPCIDVRPYLVTYLVIFIFAIIAIVFMHALIAIEFSRPIVSGGVFSEEMVTARRRTAKELMMVIMVNVVLATPDMGVKIYLLKCPKTLPVMYQVTPLLLLIHIIFFYPLYAWKNSDFRKGLLDCLSAVRSFFVRMLTRCSRPLSHHTAAGSFTRLSFRNLSRASSSSAASGNPTAITTTAATTSMITTATTNTAHTTSAATATSTSTTITTTTSTTTTTTANTTATTSTATTNTSSSPRGINNIVFHA